MLAALSSRCPTTVPAALALAILAAAAALLPPAAVAKPFDVAWSGLWPCCGGTTAFNLSAFPVLQQKRLAIFDGRLGLFNDSVPQSGGLPQAVDLARHAAKVAQDVATVVPAGKSMYGCIDWEEYTPVIYDHATPARPAGGPGSGGCPGVYTAPDGNSRYSMPGAACSTCDAAMNASVALVLKAQPGLNVSAAAAVAAAEFNAAARAVWSTTIETAKKTRPDCHWGFYGKPETEDIKPPFVNAYDRAIGDSYQWMFNISTALFPSTYMHYKGSASPPPGRSYNTEYVEAIVREAQRVNANRGAEKGKVKVLPWVWYRYISDHRTLLEPEDMHTALASPGIAGADGVLFYEDGLSWGPSAAQKAQNALVQAYIDEVVGPTATQLYGGSGACDAALRAACPPHSRDINRTTHEVIMCDACAGKHQGGLRDAGCTAAEVQAWCAKTRKGVVEDIVRSI